MSRTTNPVLTGQIVAAARRLWHQKGEKGLTLRAVARAAGTTPPSVYQRFPAKQDLIAAIADQIRLEIGSAVATSRNFEEAFERYMKLARHQRQEYLLMASTGFGQIFRKDGPRPGVEWGERELVRLRGGKLDDYEATVYAMASLLHGTASFVLNIRDAALVKDLEESCRQAILRLAEYPLHPAKRGKRRR